MKRATTLASMLALTACGDIDVGELQEAATLKPKLMAAEVSYEPSAGIPAADVQAALDYLAAFFNVGAFRLEARAQGGWVANFYQASGDGGISVGQRTAVDQGRAVHLTYHPGLDVGYLQSWDYTLGSARPLVLQVSGGNVGIGTVNPTARLEVAGGIRLTPSAPPVCNASRRGTLWFQSGGAGDRMLACVNDAGSYTWTPLGTARPGTEANPARSCLAVMDSGQRTSGAYWIHGGGGPARLLYCDMDTDGGGWTLVAKTDLSSAAHHTDEGHDEAALTSPELDAVAVLPREELNSIGETFRIEAPAAGYVLWFRDAELYTSANHDMSVTYALRARSAGQAGFHVGTVNRYPGQLGYSSGTVDDGSAELAAPMRFDVPGFWFSGGSFVPDYYAGRIWVR